METKELLLVGVAAYVLLNTGVLGKVGGWIPDVSNFNSSSSVSSSPSLDLFSPWSNLYHAVQAW